MSPCKGSAGAGKANPSSTKYDRLIDTGPAVAGNPCSCKCAGPARVGSFAVRRVSADLQAVCGVFCYSGFCGLDTATPVTAQAGAELAFLLLLV